MGVVAPANCTPLCAVQSWASDTDPIATGPPRRDAQEDLLDDEGGGYLAPAAEAAANRTLDPAVVQTPPPTSPGQPTAFTMSYSRLLDTGDAVDHVISPPPFLAAYFAWVSAGAPRPAGLVVTPRFEDIIAAWHPSRWEPVHHGANRRVRRQINLWEPSPARVQRRRNTTLPALGFLEDYSLRWEFAAGNGDLIDMDVARQGAKTLAQSASTEGVRLQVAPEFILFNIRVRIAAGQVGNGAWSGFWAAFGFGTQMIGSDMIGAFVEVDPATGTLLPGSPRVVDAAATAYSAPTPDSDASDTVLISGGYIDLDAVDLEDTLTTSTPPVSRSPPSRTDSGAHVFSVTIQRKAVPADASDVGVELPAAFVSYFQHSLAAIAAGEAVPLQGDAARMQEVFQPMVFAYRLDSPNLQYHGVNNRARARVNLFAGLGADVVQPGSLDTAQEFDTSYIIHGVTMAVAWGVVTPLSIILMEYSGGKKSFAIDLHHAVMNLVGTITIPTAAAAFSTSEAQGRPITPHGYIGITLAFLTLLQIALGQAAKAFFTSTTTPTWTLRRFKQGHVLLGLAMFPTALANVSVPASADLAVAAVFRLH